MTYSKKQPPFLGFGLGLRPDHYENILATNPHVDWFEILVENYMTFGGKPKYYLEQIAERYPIAFHGVSLSIGGIGELNYDYLKQMKALAKIIKPKLISDHLCFTGINNLNMHDLLPMPYTKEAIKTIVEKIKKVQDYLGCRILLENVSSYLTYTDSIMPEWEFLNTIINEADCLVLLDVNNIYVSAINHKFNALDYINGISANRVKQIHLAGHTNMGNHLIDTHDSEVIPDVWDLYKKTLEITGPVSTMIERDDNIPPLEVLIQELNKARLIAKPFISNKP